MNLGGQSIPGIEAGWYRRASPHRDRPGGRTQPPTIAPPVRFHYFAAGCWWSVCGAVGDLPWGDRVARGVGSAGECCAECVKMRAGNEGGKP